MVKARLRQRAPARRSKLALLALAGVALATTPALHARAGGGDGEARVAPAGAFAMHLGEASVGNVRASLLAEKAGPSEPNLLVTTGDVTPVVAVVVEGFVAGKTLATPVKLSTGAVVKKADRARLATVKLPGMGAGGAPELELAFLASALTTQPVLSLKQATTRTPSGARIESFRVDVSGLPTIAASKIDAIALTQRDGGASTRDPKIVTPVGEVALEVGAGGAPPFTAWHKASARSPVLRTLGVEYVGADGSALLKVRLEACTPSSVTPLGASGTTRIVLRCATAKPG